MQKSLHNPQSLVLYKCNALLSLIYYLGYLLMAERELTSSIQERLEGKKVLERKQMFLVNFCSKKIRKF
uniref:Uncharacterized protein n=1 Tax=Arion vulgaris TaxID=1028688 RepID=A0A0B7AEC4_9EUPU